jgi:hypothetical protein
VNELDDRLKRRIEALRRTTPPDPAALGRLRAALRADRGRQPVRLVLSPLTAALAVLAIVGLTSALWLATVVRAPTPAAAKTPVQFVLHADGARTVAVVGDFNDWDPAATPLAESGDGVWSAVVPLSPGSVRYSFLIDGREWRADPSAATAPGDFGRPSSVTLVAEPEAES